MKTYRIYFIDNNGKTVAACTRIAKDEKMAILDAEMSFEIYRQMYNKDIGYNHVTAEVINKED